MKDISKGYIALYRQFLEWEWYDDANTMRLFIHCLLLANHSDKNWRGKVIKRGQFLTSQSKLANSLKLSIMQIRNSLNKLKSTGEITVEPTNEYSVISIKNYDIYQTDNRRTSSQTTQKQQASNRRATTTNNDNKEINIYNTHTNNIEGVCEKNISAEDMKILRKYAKENGARNIKPYVNKLIESGGYTDILKDEKARIEKEKQKQERYKQNVESPAENNGPLADIQVLRDNLKYIKPVKGERKNG